MNSIWSVIRIKHLLISLKSFKNIIKKGFEGKINDISRETIKRFSKLPIDKQEQVIDFVEFIRSKQQGQLEFIAENKEAFVELFK